MDTTNLLIALLFFAGVCLYLGWEILKIRRRGEMTVNQPQDSPSLFSKFIGKPLWFFGFYPNDRRNITKTQRPLLYRFLYIWLYVVFLAFCTGFLMILLQLLNN